MDELNDIADVVGSSVDVDESSPVPRRQSTRLEQLAANGMLCVTTDGGREMLTCERCGWRIRAIDKKKAEGHVSGLVLGVAKCAGSIQAKEARRASNHRDSESRKRGEKNQSRALKMQAARNRDTKHRAGRPVTNPDGVKSKFRAYDREKPNVVGRLPINATEAPRGTLGGLLPTIAFYEDGAAPGNQDVDPTTSVYVHKLPNGKHPREIEAHIGALSFHGYTLMGAESVVASLSASAVDTATTAYLPGVGAPERQDLADGDSMLWSYIRVRPGDVYGVVVAEFDGDPGWLRYRTLRAVGEDEFQPFSSDLEAFPGVELDPDATGAKLAFALTDTFATVQDEHGPNSAILNAGKLFVWCPESQLFYGIVNLDVQAEHSEHARASASEMATRQDAGATRRPVDIAAVSTPHFMDLRDKLRPVNIHRVAAPPPELMEVFLMRGEKPFTPLVCSKGVGSSDCTFSQQRFSRKGNNEADDDAELVKHDHKIITMERAHSYTVKRYWCSTHNQWESSIGPLCGELVGKNGVSLSVDVLFPMGSRHGISGAAVTQLCQLYATLGSVARVRRHFLAAWVRHRETELDAVMPSLSDLERVELRELAAQERLQMQADLPRPEWFQNVFLAVHAMWIKPRVEKAMKIMWLVCGQWVQIDFGHTSTSNCISTTSAPAGPTARPTDLDPGEGVQGELRSANLTSSTRTSARATYDADTLVVIGQGGFEIMPQQICPTESHEQVTKLVLAPLMAHRLQQLGPYYGAIALVASDKMAADDLFFRSALRDVFPVAFAEYEDYMTVCAQDIPPDTVEDGFRCTVGFE